MVIQALKSVVAAGVKDDGLPKLALCRADSTACVCRINHDGGARMHAQGAQLFWNSNRDTSRCHNFRTGSFPAGRWREGLALVPPIPLHLRPRRALANYHILWEAEWTRIPPADPYLLRRIGKADLWLVVAAWDLTEVERAVLATRLANA